MSGFRSGSAGSDDSADHGSPTSQLCKCKRIKRGETYITVNGYRHVRWRCEFCDNPESEAEWDPRLHEAPESD